MKKLKKLNEKIKKIDLLLIQENREDIKRFFKSRKISSTERNDIIRKIKEVSPELKNKNNPNKYLFLFVKLYVGLDDEKKGEFLEETKKLKNNLEDLERKSLDNIKLHSIKSIKEFKEEVKKRISIITKSTRGMNDLIEGIHYVDVTIDGFEGKMYVPLSHKASRIIASENVGDSNTEAKWCCNYYILS